MYRHQLIEPSGQVHELLLGASFYGDEALGMALAALNEGKRYTKVNRMPYLDGQPFTGTIKHHWGSIYHFRDGLLHDPAPMVPAVCVSGPRGQVCFYKGGLRDDPAEGVPALIPNDSRPVCYSMGMPYPARAINAQAVSMVRSLAEIALQFPPAAATSAPVYNAPVAILSTQLPERMRGRENLG